MPLYTWKVSYAIVGDASYYSIHLTESDANAKVESLKQLALIDPSIIDIKKERIAPQL